ncbi:uncharacterized protein BO97DRAFT_66870 [Aspergillus homomorphus CBS 101889]|uniref:Uncharacterized protein n=1 Tax=Aspergillus homomorphus (strain CBS 101889) TaxID=1450537 RepID=A0A395HVJ7_ASPHC|nr:hypothetical protein BO97DRAFT_66870 [Aspergillus homomorphus CBS 101889]RAL11952.1 hypothetical protein BO97DRAFT_66870 [Aspergillus homomorphus CBS 101889]
MTVNHRYQTRHAVYSLRSWIPYNELGMCPPREVPAITRLEPHPLSCLRPGPATMTLPEAQCSLDDLPRYGSSHLQFVHSQDQRLLLSSGEATQPISARSVQEMDPNLAGVFDPIQAAIAGTTQAVGENHLRLVTGHTRANLFVITRRGKSWRWKHLFAGPGTDEP